MSWISSLFNNLFGHSQPPAPPVPKPAGPVSRALLVAINKMPGNELRGCINDSNSVKKALLEDWGFKADEIVQLFDQKATTRNILANLEWLVAVPPGSRIIFGYSGHGAQVPTDDPSEPDGLSEVIVPFDFSWTPSTMITDKQFVQVFSKIPPGCFFNWISDSCHSGNLEKSIIKGNPKTISHPLHIHSARKRLHAKGKKVRALVGGLLDCGFVAACRSDQTASDTEIGGTPCGAASHFFLEALKKMRSTPLVEIVLSANQALAANGYDQVMQAEGVRRTRPWLG